MGLLMAEKRQEKKIVRQTVSGCQRALNGANRRQRVFTRVICTEKRRVYSTKRHVVSKYAIQVRRSQSSTIPSLGQRNIGSNCR